MQLLLVFEKSSQVLNSSNKTVFKADITGKRNGTFDIVTWKSSGVVFESNVLFACKNAYLRELCRLVPGKCLKRQFILSESKDLKNSYLSMCVKLAIPMKFLTDISATI